MLYTVTKIDNKLAKLIAVKKHYLHRKPTCRFSFGLFDENKRLLGIIIFSQPASPNVVKSVLGKDKLSYQKQLLELNRLWVDDECPRNTESWFISKALNLLPSSIVISYSDMGYNHKGIVYRASNFNYAGSISPKRTHSIKGEGYHPRQLSVDDRKSGKIIKKEYTKKIRYWTVTGNKKEKKELKKLVLWPIINWKINSIH